jgi:uncharacterized membrane protein
VTLSARRTAVVVSLGLASLGCCGLVLVRNVYTGNENFRYLIWNLFLAWVPFVLALLFYDGQRRGMRAPALAVLGALWLAFFPNAPYIVTDFVHLSANRRPPLWFDGVELSAFAWTGMLLGFVSLYLVHAVLRHRFGGGVGWTAVLAVLALVSAGVFLGRVKRWNSWDVITQPRTLLAQLHDHLLDPRALAHATALTLAMTAALAAAYGVFYALMAARLERD